MNAQLELHQSLYENLVRVALQTPLDAPDEATSLVEDAATFAFQEYPGLLLENRLNRSVQICAASPKARRTQIFWRISYFNGALRVGKTLQNWIGQDDSGEALLASGTFNRTPETLTEYSQWREGVFP